MDPENNQQRNCGTCGAPYNSGQERCQRCFAILGPGTTKVQGGPPAPREQSRNATAPIGPGSSLDDITPSKPNNPRIFSPEANLRSAPPVMEFETYFEPDTGTVFVQDRKANNSDSPAKESLELDEPNTGAWSKADLSPNAWDLAEQDEQENFPITRKEVRRAKQDRRQSTRQKRVSVSIMVLAILAVVAIAGYLFYDQEFSMNPHRYRVDVSPVVDKVNSQITGATVLAQQVAISEVPTAHQIVQAKTMATSLNSLYHNLISFTAPSGDRKASEDLAIGIQRYGDLFATIDSVSSSDILVNIGQFSYDLEDANLHWRLGCRGLGLTFSQIVIPASVLPPVPLGPQPPVATSTPSASTTTATNLSQRQ